MRYQYHRHQALALGVREDIFVGRSAPKKSGRRVLPRFLSRSGRPDKSEEFCTFPSHRNYSFPMVLTLLRILGGLARMQLLVVTLILLVSRIVLSILVRG